MMSDDGIAISRRKITLSTSSIIPNNEKTGVELVLIWLFLCMQLMIGKINWFLLIKNIISKVYATRVETILNYLILKLHGSM